MYPKYSYSIFVTGGVSSAKFELAIEQIISANIEVSRLQAGVSEWHFNAEQVTQGMYIRIILCILGQLTGS